MSDNKQIKIVTGEGQETFVPEPIANDEASLKRLLASFYGTDNFRIERKEENGETVIQVVKLAGAKGSADSPLVALFACEGGENPAITLYRQVSGLDLTTFSPEDVMRLQGRVEAALKTGQDWRERLGQARSRLKRSRPCLSSVPIPGF